MKKFHFKDLFRIFVITACVITGFSPTGCMKPLDYTEFYEYGDKIKEKNRSKKLTPSVKDFDISGLGQDRPYLLQEQLDVKIVPKEGSTQGEITIFCEGYKGDKYQISDIPPDQAGAYAVTFNSDETEYFNAAEDLYAGFLMINNPDYNFPENSHFDIGGTGPRLYKGEPYEVTVAPYPGKSNGKITVNYYKGEVKIDGPPAAVGVYFVTFNVDVDDEGKFNAAYGLAAGTLTIRYENTPTADNFNITGLATPYFFKDPLNINIEPKYASKENVNIITYFEGDNYKKSDENPSKAGIYIVTFDVDEAEGYNAAKNLYAGTLTIILQTPTVADFNITGVKTLYIKGSPLNVKIEAKNGKTEGKTTIKYKEITDEEINPNVNVFGVYGVFFDVEEDPGKYNEVKDLFAGILTVYTMDMLKNLPPSKDPNDSYSMAMGNQNTLSDIINTLNQNKDKYFDIDLTDSNITSIGSSAFSSIENLTSIIISDRVTSIDNAAFSRCLLLESVTIGNGVKTIGDSAFAECGRIKNLIIGENVETIGDHAFYSCAQLKSVTIPASVKNIGHWTFQGCMTLDTVIFEGSPTLDTSGSFTGSNCLESVYVGKGTYFTFNPGYSAIWAKQ
jgi:hypothetical protein